MNFDGWVNLNDLLKACGYNYSSDNSDEGNRTSNNSNTTNNFGCYDMPNGFQDLSPELFIIIGEILGNIIAGSIPFNVQNTLGNWLQLVGQAIETYNAQQQYFQSGPGRYYDPKNFNVTNPFCSSNSTSSTTSNKSNSKNNDANRVRIEELEKQVQQLTNEINEIKILLQKE